MSKSKEKIIELNFPDMITDDDYFTVIINTSKKKYTFTGCLIETFNSSSIPPIKRNEILIRGSQVDYEPIKY